MNNSTTLNWTKAVSNGISNSVASTEEMTITISKVNSKWVAIYKFQTKRLKPFKSNHKSKTSAMDCAYNFATSFMSSDIWQNAKSI